MCRRSSHRSLPICLWLLVVLVLLAGVNVREPITLAESLAGPGDYILGPGDVLEISVWGHEDLAAVVTIRQDGKISFPLIGDIQASGLTLAQLREHMSSQLAEYVKQPSVTVILKQQRVLNIRVLGEVRAPGVYQLKPGQTVADAIAMAGGLTDRGDDLNVMVSGRRASGTVSIKVDLTKAFVNGEALGLTLEDGDTVFVPKTIEVQVMGSVNAPGSYFLPRGSDLLYALARAGGVTLQGDSGRIQLTHGGSVIELSLDEVRSGAGQRSPELADGDVIFVPELVQEVSVIGEVARPGVYRIREGKTRLVDVIASAGGITPEGDAANVTITRRTSKGEEVFVENLDLAPGEAGRGGGFELADGDVVNVPKAIRIQVLGEVHAPGVYFMRARSSATDAIAKAGGVKPTGDGTSVVLTRTKDGSTSRLVIDIDAIISNSAADGATGAKASEAAAGEVDTSSARVVTLEDGDVLYVPPAFFKVSVLGEVQRPGVYELKKGSRLLDALAEAGGVGKEGDPTSVSLMRKASGDVVTVDVEKLLALAGSAQAQERNPELAPGDVITVPKAIKVQVLGQVQAPGTYFMPKGAAVMDAIGRAGGLRPDAGASAITLTRQGQPVKQVSWEAMLSGDQAQNERLSDGDVIFVPEVPSEVSVLGEVARPGVYKVYAGTRLLDVIAAAGGATDQGDTSNVTVTRTVGSVDGSAGPQTQVFKVDLEALSRGEDGGAGNIVIKRGDVIYVPKAIAVQVLGRVARPGSYRLKANSRLTEALAMAGGITENGNPSQVTLTRAAEEPAGVPRVVLVNVDDILAGKASDADYRLKDGDIITVAEAERRVLVVGEVQRPGIYEVRKGAFLMDAIALAGGPTDRAALESVAVFRGGKVTDSREVNIGMDNLLFKGDVKENPPIYGGDIIYVPETKKLDWNKVFSFLSGLKLVKDLFLLP